MNLEEATLHLIDKWKNRYKAIVEQEGFYVETDVLEDWEDEDANRTRDNEHNR